MRFKPYAAFGYTVIVSKAEPGDTRSVTLGDDGLVTSGYYYYTKGAAKVKVIETNEQLADRSAGWLNSEHTDAHASSTGTLELSFLESTEWLCIPHKYNKEGLPNLVSWSMEGSNTAVLPNKTDLFLTSGSVQINNKLFVSPCQIRVRSGDVTVVNLSTEKIYGLVFQ
jgi:hypothetical protein